MKTAHSTYKALSEPVRLRIILLLMQRDSLCVCDLVGTLKLPQSTVSRHLSHLKNADMVKSWRDGTWVIYALKPEALAPVNKSFLNNLITQDAQYQDDSQALTHYENSPDKCSL